jgi:hypothetical protein
MTQQSLRRSIGLLLPLLLSYTPAFAELEGAQRKSVFSSTYKSCLSSAAKSSPQASRAEKHNWCMCYTKQVVDNVTPNDVKSFSGTSGPSSKMARVADDAIAYCRSKL